MIKSKVFLCKYFIFAFFVYSIVRGGFEVDGKPIDSNEVFGKGGIENNDQPDDTKNPLDELRLEFIKEGLLDESIYNQRTSTPILFKSHSFNFETLTMKPFKFAYDDTKLKYDLENKNYVWDYSRGFRVGWPFVIIVLVVTSCCCCCCQKTDEIAALIVICIRCCCFRKRLPADENPRRGFVYNILVVERRAGAEQPAGFANSALVTDDEQRRESTDMPPSYETIVPERQSANSPLSSPPATLPVAQNE